MKLLFPGSKSESPKIKKAIWFSGCWWWLWLLVRISDQEKISKKSIKWVVLQIPFLNLLCSICYPFLQLWYIWPGIYIIFAYKMNHHGYIIMFSMSCSNFMDYTPLFKAWAPQIKSACNIILWDFRQFIDLLVVKHNLCWKKSPKKFFNYWCEWSISRPFEISWAWSGIRFWKLIFKT